MVRVQPDKFRGILADQVMDVQYHQFGPSDSSSVHAGPNSTTQAVFTGMRRIVFYCLYGFLVLLLLILLLVTTIKFSQTNKEINNIKHYIEKVRHGAAAAPSSEVKPATIPAIVPQRGSCASGWVSYQRSCYLLSSSAVTWSQAEQQCQTHGGHLLVVNSVEELDFISGLVDIRYNYWMGLVERQNEGHWSWVDGTEFSSTTAFWDEGQPDDWDYRENGEDCGQLHGSTTRIRKLWNDADCELNYRFICESRA